MSDVQQLRLVGDDGSPAGPAPAPAPTATPSRPASHPPLAPATTATCSPSRRRRRSSGSAERAPTQLHASGGQRDATDSPWSRSATGSSSRRSCSRRCSRASDEGRASGAPLLGERHAGPSKIVSALSSGEPVWRRCRRSTTHVRPLAVSPEVGVADDVRGCGRRQTQRSLRTPGPRRPSGDSTRAVRRPGFAAVVLPSQQQHRRLRCVGPSEQLSEVSVSGQ